MSFPYSFTAVVAHLNFQPAEVGSFQAQSLRLWMKHAKQPSISNAWPRSAWIFNLQKHAMIGYLSIYPYVSGFPI
jgi:hypothetical protein